MPIRKFLDSREEMENVLERETLGFLGLSRDGGPYVVPLNYIYAGGRILFHCALTGRKLDFLKENPRVCFAVGMQTGKVIRHPQGATCRAGHESVICFGTARLLEDIGERREALDAFNRRLQPDAKSITLDDAAKCLAVEIRIEEMTGRRWGDGKAAAWRYRFPA
jgi:nitroimidazol reductase NimA-like FMN-containing flavoprotein (pyridoxamine 5'-phosphate oxidase superfamily)